MNPIVSIRCLTPTCRPMTPKNGLLRAVTLAAAIACGATALAPAEVQAANAATGTGIGFVLGSPTGFSLKLPQGRANAWQFTLGYDLDGGHWNGPDHAHDHGTHFFLGGDYLWYNYNLIRVPRGRLPVYYGPGAWVSFHSHDGDAHSRAGVRGVIGLAYQFATAPFDIFLEVGPGISVIPDTHGHGFGGLGARFYF